VCAYAQDLSHFLPVGNYAYDPSIPTPASFFGHEIGAQHITYDLATAYLKSIAQKSERVIFEDRGRTYQYRPILFLYISSPQNLANLEQIRIDHQKLCDHRESHKLDVQKMPIITWLGYSVHGNEASGINASIAVAYFLAAAQGPEIERILTNSVIIIQPGTNPDGIQRFTTWVNNNRSFTAVKDPNSREFREPNPGSRGNHYWFDLNRDWVTNNQPESFYRSQLFYEWHPTLQADFHEHGNTSGMFFSPGIKTSHNPDMPKESYNFMSMIAKQFHSKYLTDIGSVTYSKESYDGWFTGCGDALPHLLGGVSFLFEQTSSRGHIQELSNGVTLRFADAVRNQAVGSYSTIQAGVEMKDELLDYQRRAYKEAQLESAKSPIKAYVFSNPENKSLDVEFFRILNANNINVHQLNRDITIGGKTFHKADSYIVPCDQQEYRVINTIFRTDYTYVDSTFYGVSTWTIPLAFSMNYQALLSSTAGFIGEKVTHIEPSSFAAPPLSDYAYLFEIKDFYSYKFLYLLLEKGIKVRVTDTPIKIEVNGTAQQFGYGTLIIPRSVQTISNDQLHRSIVEAAKGIPVEVFAVNTNRGDPIDLGSPRFKEINIPKIALICGQGAASDGIGAIWHLLDQRMAMPATLLESTLLGNAHINLNKYNVMVFFGNFSFDPPVVEKLQVWAKNKGNTIIGIGPAFKLLNEIDVANIHTQKGAENANNATYLNFSEITEIDPNSIISGVILESYLDPSHPIAYGIGTNTINTFKTQATIFSKPTGKFMAPAYYQKSPWLSGCITAKNIQMLSETPSVLASKNVIYFADDPCFRAHWFGSTRLLLNSFFFRELMPTQKIETLSASPLTN
jgi:hypothetical protein